MSRTSSDGRAFTRAFWWTTAVTAGVAAVFLLLGAMQGPKLSTAQVDSVRVTEQAGQQLRLFANQPLSEITAEQVSVDPAVPVQVSVQGELIAVQFERALDYSTDYTVTVSGVASPSRSATSDFVHTFTTAPGSFVYVDRGETVDEVLVADVAGTGRGEVLHTAPGIQFAAPLENALILARDDGSGGSILEVVDRASDAVEQVRLPADGLRIDALQVPRVGTTVALIVSATDGADGAANRWLALVDLAGVGVADWVTGLDGEPIAALDAFFTQAGDALLIHDIDQALFRLPLADPSLILPVAQFTEVHGVSSDGGRLSATDPFGGVAFDLDSSEEERINPSLFDDALVFGADFHLLASGEWVQRVAVTDSSGLAVANLIVVDDGAGESRLLARTVSDAGSFVDFRVSPNDQFVAIEVVPVVAEAQPDGRAVNGRATSITVVIVNIATGDLVRSVAGFAPTW
ncbi:hypothetical protein EV140_1017 [Microcella alkaliphila]|uniref:SbsA Ig-like domain-containing protein n=1 Tax=Microcella alkaliphila TaxID=279828 RepID=A0A4Q7TRU8_9MICO|nr:hypothetical protein [Microcella alkaliphila]RZT62488.1 hypothetical protein EV140_1017 [Microcella alkaliphila]